MKAIVYTKYGSEDTLHLQEMAKPVPQGDEVLVKIHAVSVNYADWHMLTGEPFLARLEFGLFKPQRTILGADIAGMVEAVGPTAALFKPGDAVYGDILLFGSGGFAEYVSVTEKALASKPANLSFGEAAAVPMAAVTALQVLRDGGEIQAGQKVLIHGAAGGVGTFAVQLARMFGAEVTAVCSARNIDLVRSLGADHVIDYSGEDFTRNGQTYDLVLGINGNRSIQDYRRVLKPGGRYFMVGGSDKQIFQALLLGPFLSRGQGQKLGGFTSSCSRQDLQYLKELLEAGKIKPVIDRTYPLEQAAEAMRYVGSGHPRAKVVLSVVPAAG
jgi:NADPH:quinone reductase-like Zn-dependent oxidoreductase